MVISVLKRKIADEFNKLTTLEEQLEFIVEMGLELSLEESVAYNQGAAEIQGDVTNHVCFRGVQAMDVKMNPLKCGRLSIKDLLKLGDAGIEVHGDYFNYFDNETQSQINFEL